MAFRGMGDWPPAGPFMQRDLSTSLLFGERKVGYYLAVGAVVVVGTLKIVSYINKKNRRKRWNNVGQDKVILHMFQRGRFCPNLSPFVVKLETYLRMAQIPYEVDFEEPMGPKEKFPWITLNGEEIADSQLIMEKLGSMFNKDFSVHLSAEEKAVGSAMRIMVDKHLLWCYRIWRFITDNSRAYMECMKTSPLFIFSEHAVLVNEKKRAIMQGMGRHSDEDIEEFGRKALLNLSSWLGNKPYFMGDKPTEVDCAIFGMLAQIEWNSPGSPYLSMIKGDFKNLSAYCYRVKEKYWPDWNQCLNPPQP